MSDTIAQYDEIVARAREIVKKKNYDYGDSWKELRLSSITDQIYVNAKRIRQIEEAGGKHHFWFTTFDRISPQTVLTEKIWSVATVNDPQPLMW